MTKKLFLSLVFLFMSNLLYAASLLPGAKVVQMFSYSVNSGVPPQINGKIINYSQHQSLRATNTIKVPNQFPIFIPGNMSGNYSVSPPAPVDGYVQWTNPIKYLYADGTGCYIQFAWDPTAKSTYIALSSVTTDMTQCASKWSNPNFGTNISICSHDASNACM